MSQQSILMSGTAAEENEQLSQLLTSELDGICHLHWQYTKTNVVLGRSQKVTEQMQARAQQHDAIVHQRVSGGGAVLASSNLVSVSTIIPIDHPLAKLDLIECFRVFGRIWHAALEDLGVKSMVCETVDKGAPEQQWICFAGASHGELFDDADRKLLGLAQVRKRKGIAIMMGVYLRPIEWEALFDIFQGSYNEEDVARIREVTTSLQQAGLKCDDTTPAKLMDRFNYHLCNELMHY